MELSIQMSMWGISSRKRSLPRGVDRLRVVWKLLRRFCTQPEATVEPSAAGIGNSRLRHTASPGPVRSIWITSAPISAAMAAAKGWAIMVPVDRIRTPCRGPNCRGNSGGGLFCMFSLAPVWLLPCVGSTVRYRLSAIARTIGPDCRSPATRGDAGPPV